MNAAEGSLLGDRTVRNDFEPFRLYFHGFPSNFNENNVKCLFEQFGIPMDIRIIRPLNGLHFAFLTLPSKASALKAIEAFDEKLFGGSKLKLCKARPPTKRNTGALDNNEQNQLQWRPNLVSVDESSQLAFDPSIENIDMFTNRPDCDNPALEEAHSEENEVLRCSKEQTDLPVKQDFSSSSSFERKRCDRRGSSRTIINRCCSDLTIDVGLSSKDPVDVLVTDFKSADCFWVQFLGNDEAWFNLRVAMCEWYFHPGSVVSTVRLNYPYLASIDEITRVLVIDRDSEEDNYRVLCVDLGYESVASAASLRTILECHTKQPAQAALVSYRGVTSQDPLLSAINEKIGEIINENYYKLKIQKYASTSRYNFFGIDVVAVEIVEPRFNSLQQQLTNLNESKRETSVSVVTDFVAASYGERSENSNPAIEVTILKAESGSLPLAQQQKVSCEHSKVKVEINSGTLSAHSSLQSVSNASSLTSEQSYRPPLDPVSTTIQGNSGTSQDGYFLNNLVILVEKPSGRRSVSVTCMTVRLSSRLPVSCLKRTSQANSPNQIDRFGCNSNPAALAPTCRSKATSPFTCGNIKLINKPTTFDCSTASQTVTVDDSGETFLRDQNTDFSADYHSTPNNPEAHNSVSRTASHTASAIKKVPSMSPSYNGTEFKRSLPEQFVPLGYPVRVSIRSDHIRSDFFVAMLVNNQEFSKIMEALKKFNTLDNSLIQSFLCPIHSPRVGDYYLCEHCSVSQFHRVQLLSRDPTSGDCQVLFVDYGDLRQVKASLLFAIPNQLASVPPQAFGCCPPKPLSDSTVEKMSAELVANDCCHVVFAPNYKPGGVIRIVQKIVLPSLWEITSSSGSGDVP